MKNILLRIGMVVFIFALLVFVPLNVNQIFGYGTVSTPTCDNEKPAKVVLYEPNHALLPKATGVGEVRLNWLKAERANKYTIGFGTSPRNYIYGVTNIPDTNNYTVKYLNPGTRYYFAVKAVNECMPGDWSREWSVLVGGTRATTFTHTGGSTSGEVIPTAIPTVIQKRQESGGNEIPTLIPTTEEQNQQPAVEDITPTPEPNFIQRFFNWLFGK